MSAFASASASAESDSFLHENCDDWFWSILSQCSDDDTGRSSWDYGSGLSGGPIAGIVVGVVGGVIVLVAIIVLLVICCYRRQKKAQPVVGIVLPSHTPYGDTEGGGNAEMNTVNNVDGVCVVALPAEWQNERVPLDAAGPAVPPTTQQQCLIPSVSTTNPYSLIMSYYYNSINTNDCSSAAGVPLQQNTGVYGNGAYYVRENTGDEARAFTPESSTLPPQNITSSGSEQSTSSSGNIRKAHSAL